MNALETLAARLQAGEMVQPLPGLTLSQAYEVAALRHRLRLDAGDTAIGRKIGHTNTVNWAAQGIDAPSWGWLYASSTESIGDTLSLSAWREPKIELECVLRLSRTPASVQELPGLRGRDGHRPGDRRPALPELGHRRAGLDRRRRRACIDARRTLDAARC